MFFCLVLKKFSNLIKKLGLCRICFVKSGYNNRKHSNYYFVLFFYQISSSWKSLNRDTLIIIAPLFLAEITLLLLFCLTGEEVINLGGPLLKHLM